MPNELQLGIVHSLTQLNQNATNRLSIVFRYQNQHCFIFTLKKCLCVKPLWFYIINSIKSLQVTFAGNLCNFFVHRQKTLFNYTTRYKFKSEWNFHSNWRHKKLTFQNKQAPCCYVHLCSVCFCDVMIFRVHSVAISVYKRCNHLHSCQSLQNHEHTSTHTNQTHNTHTYIYPTLIRI